MSTKVSPEVIGADDFLYHIDGVKNAICFETDTIGEILAVGPGAGRRETGYAIFSDLINIHEALSKIEEQKWK